MNSNLSSGWVMEGGEVKNNYFCIKKVRDIIRKNERVKINRETQFCKVYYFSKFHVLPFKWFSSPAVTTNSSRFTRIAFLFTSGGNGRIYKGILGENYTFTVNFFYSKLCLKSKFNIFVLSIGWFSPCPFLVWQVRSVLWPGDWWILFFSAFIYRPHLQSHLTG